MSNLRTVHGIINVVLLLDVALIIGCAHGPVAPGPAVPDSGTVEAPGNAQFEMDRAIVRQQSCQRPCVNA